MPCGAAAMKILVNLAFAILCGWALAQLVTPQLTRLMGVVVEALP